MLQILGNALEMPNGIHSDLWSPIKRARLYKFSTLNQDMHPLVPEAFFKSNKVVIKPRNLGPRTSRSGVEREREGRPYITYPNIE